MDDVLFVKCRKYLFNLLEGQGLQRDFFSETEIPNLGLRSGYKARHKELHTQQHGGHMLPGQEQQGSYQDSVQG